MRNACANLLPGRFAFFSTIMGKGMSPRPSRFDYYTVWAFGLFVVSIVLKRVYPCRVLTALQDAACVNSIVVGLIGPYIICTFKATFNDPQAELEYIKNIRLPFNAIMHATPAAIAPFLLYYNRPCAEQRQHILAILAAFFVLYMGFPTGSKVFFFRKIRLAYHLKYATPTVIFCILGVLIVARSASFA